MWICQFLDEYDNVVIQKEQRNYEENIAWPMGNFMSFKVDSIDELFTTYDKEKLLEIGYKAITSESLNS